MFPLRAPSNPESLKPRYRNEGVGVVQGADAIVGYVPESSGNIYRELDLYL